MRVALSDLLVAFGRHVSTAFMAEPARLVRDMNAMDTTMVSEGKVINWTPLYRTPFIRSQPHLLNFLYTFTSPLNAMDTTMVSEEYDYDRRLDAHRCLADGGASSSGELGGSGGQVSY